MAVLQILEYPDKRLRTQAQKVEAIDSNVQKIAADMYETMYASQGVGLAATQVNIHQRIITIDVSNDKSAPICLINPKLIHQEGSQFEVEGCLSFPTAYDKVERAAIIRVQALNLAGETFELAADGLLAICIQHEIDHLNGVLFIDHLSRLKQDRLAKKIIKFRRALAVDHQ